MHPPNVITGSSCFSWERTGLSHDSVVCIEVPQNESTSFCPDLLLYCLHNSFLLCVCQIAPAESPEVTERMVIITGTPEAQFKVTTL